MEILGTEILSNILYLIAQSLFIPVIIVVLVFITYAVLSLGSFLTEKFSRIKFDVNKTEKLIRVISKSSNPEEMKEKVCESQLQDKYKEVIIKIISNHDIGPQSRRAIATKLIEEEELQFSTITQKTDTLVRLAPTVGLLGTLIPLGPGLSALGAGDINSLAQSLMVAFDTTITGLAAGSIGFIISRYRKKWYTDELSILEAIVESTLEALDNVQEKTIFR
ncbi:MotA/TolQ/ExbB proton channel family protein [Methanobacterium formicicum]|jgi:biopolymer transport protein ExbB/TolQ|uniref:MotA/TolQ/ExbB proton channel family protein n=1 Tax=Methanobacterium formicicum TaxID=2162 RepID=A0A089ZHL6_METFO|nr:MotA/TolQ/ExbB proton channel family protein [Methanobacterium formicicum]AIS31888.1 MotA/TolQ/ExbB proton channel family protein [Methanobacterium formicicum]MDG3547175.1 MotA/TolQ/ExbB proton channel family protein [Methanobacterium formicicum]CEL24909.1 MotA/TolQ/ExbB proton channel family protein [Methanobacterium formicicum]